MWHHTTSFTNFHIDFGGSSVFYHIIAGRKIFWLIEPAKSNLNIFEKWSNLSDEELQKKFFLDYLKSADQNARVFKLEFEAGQTVFIPAGWFHAVYTPEDSAVFGGNFLQSANFHLQIRVNRLDLKMETDGNPSDSAEPDESYLFPEFDRLNWCVLLLVFNDYKGDFISHRTN